MCMKVLQNQHIVNRTLYMIQHHNRLQNPFSILRQNTVLSTTATQILKLQPQPLKKHITIPILILHPVMIRGKRRKEGNDFIMKVLNSITLFYYCNVSS